MPTHLYLPEIENPKCLLFLQALAVDPEGATQAYIPGDPDATQAYQIDTDDVEDQVGQKF